MGGSIDPIGYDVAELRELARVRGDRYVADEFLWLERPASLPPPGETAEYDRPVAWTGSLDERQKPYLRRLPADEPGSRVAREWVQGLVDRAGSDGAVDALSYYESLGWVTEAVRDELEGYLLAVDYRPGGSLDDLSRADHVESLARTARLARLSDPDADTGEETDRPEDERTDDRPEGEEWDGGHTSVGDRWLDAVVSDAGPPTGTTEGGSGDDESGDDESGDDESGDGEDDDGSGDGEDDDGFEFGRRRE